MFFFSARQLKVCSLLQVLKVQQRRMLGSLLCHQLQAHNLIIHVMKFNVKTVSIIFFPLATCIPIEGWETWRERETGDRKEDLEGGERIQKSGRGHRRQSAEPEVMKQVDQHIMELLEEVHQHNRTLMEQDPFYDPRDERAAFLWNMWHKLTCFYWGKNEQACVQGYADLNWWMSGSWLKWPAIAITENTLGSCCRFSAMSPSCLSATPFFLATPGFPATPSYSSTPLCFYLPTTKHLPDLLWCIQCPKWLTFSCISGSIGLFWSFILVMRHIFRLCHNYSNNKKKKLMAIYWPTISTLTFLTLVFAYFSCCRAPLFFFWTFLIPFLL